MDRFENVTVLKKANVYFDGRVTSRTILFADGQRKTLGVMLPGLYEFNTGDRETMEVTGGSVSVKLPDKPEWQSFSVGESFDVPAKSSFVLRVEEVFDYICSYFKD